MAGFVAQLAAINKVADESPGFVWRLQDGAGDATSFHAFDDPLMLLNFSIWESVEALRDFVYAGGHVQPLRRRAEWFEKPTEAHMVLWWIPAGHIPSIAECLERLEGIRTRGETEFAFSFKRPFPAPEAKTAEV